MSKVQSLKVAVQCMAMSSKEIAELTGKQHKNVLADIRKIIIELHGEASLAKFSAYDKIPGPKGASRNSIYFNLPKHETLVLISGYSIALRSAIIARWQSLESDLNSRITSRREARLEYVPMTDAVKELHEDPKSYHFSNESDLINRIVLGVTAAKFREFHNIEETEALRDYLTTQQISAVQHLQKTNTAMLEVGLDYAERKVKLQELFNRKHANLLIREHARLEA